MTQELPDRATMVLVAIVVAILWTLIVYKFGFNQGVIHNSKEAISHGYMKYVIDKNSNITTEWISVDERK
jgi:hypothetical protein